MKKTVLLTAALFMVTLLVQAQEEKAQEVKTQEEKAKDWHYGVKAGINGTNIIGNGMATGFTFGVNAGVFAEHALSKKWSFQPELLYNQTNTKKGSDFLTYYNISGYYGSNESVKLSYISIPLLFKYNINKTFDVDAGPQYSFLVYDNENLISSGKDAFKKNDVGIVAGGQLHLEGFRVYARYIYGVLNANNIDDRYKWHTSQVQFGFGVTLR